MKWSIISFALLVLASCQHRQEQLDPTIEHFFTEESGDARKPAQFAQAQAAAGARADATLSRHHFDGRRLNSLGQEKLALMLEDAAAAEPLRVYLNVDPRDAVSGARRDAVIAFARDAGLTDSQVEIIDGHNPQTWSRSSTHLSDLTKTYAGPQAQATPSAQTDTAPGTPATGAGAAGGEINLFK